MNKGSVCLCTEGREGRVRVVKLVSLVSCGGGFIFLVELVIGSLSKKLYNIITM